MKLARTLTLLWANDEDAEEKLLETTLNQVVDDDAIAALHSGSVLEVAALAVDMEVPFGALTSATRVLLVVSGDVTVKLNGGAESISVKAMPVVLAAARTRSDRGVFYVEGAISQIQISNPDDTNPVQVLYSLAGV